MTFQESEIVSLIVAAAFVLSIAFLHRVIRLPRLPLIYAAIFILMGGHLFTVLEGVGWYAFFDILEHVCYALSGVLFAAGCWSLALAAVKQETPRR